MARAQRVGRLWNVVVQPADDRDLAAVTREIGGTPRLDEEIRRQAIGAYEIAFDGCREPGDHDGDVAGSVDVSHGHSDAGASARHVERQQLTPLAVSLAEDLTGGAHGGQLRDGLLVRDASGPATERPDGHRTGQAARSADEVTPGSSGRLQRGDLPGQVCLGTVEQDPVGSVSRPSRKPVGGSDQLGPLRDDGVLLARREVRPPRDHVAGGKRGDRSRCGVGERGPIGPGRHPRRAGGCSG